MKKGIFFGIVSIACLLVGWQKNYFSKPKTLVVYAPTKAMSSKLSFEALSDLQTYFSDNRNFASCADCAQKITNQFSFVESLRFSFNKKAAYNVAFALPRPLFLVNDALVLTDAHRVTPKEVWSSQILSELPVVTVAQVEDFSQWGPYLAMLTDSLLESYDVTWISNSRIQLRDKSYPALQLLAAADTPLQIVTDPACLYLKKALKERLLQSKGQKKDWTIDVRFKNQMILFCGGIT